jgi:hypothetical protein
MLIVILKFWKVLQTPKHVLEVQIIKVKYLLQILNLSVLVYINGGTEYLIVVYK